MQDNKEMQQVQERGMIEAVAETKESVDEQKELREFVANPENKQKALALAEQIQEAVGKNWFPIERLVKKSSESRQSAYHKIQLCKMFDLLVTRVGDFKDGAKLIRQPLFKIVITDQDQIDGLKRIIEYHKAQIQAMELQVINLEDKLKKKD